MSTDNPFPIGHRVRITQGRHRGYSGEVLSINEHGWLTVRCQHTAKGDPILVNGSREVPYIDIHWLTPKEVESADSEQGAA